MASFKDNVPTFNPYVSQQPVDAMVRVGMVKQQQYDTNLQKIKQSMSNIAGLDIARGVDREYLEGKMQDMSKKLNVYASSDLSSNNLTSNLKSMINGVADDDVVRNAVQSTMRYKQQLQFIDKEKQDGTLTPDNMYHFEKQANSWFNNEEQGAVFNGQYVKHFDVMEHAREVFKSVKPDGYEFDDLFSGVDASGQPILSPALKRMKKEGVMPQKAKEVIDGIFSDPRVKQQLQISGEYNYRGHTPEQLVGRISQQQVSTIRRIDNDLDELKIRKELGQDVQKNIDNLLDQKQQINDNFSAYIQAAEANPDMARGQLYIDEQRSAYIDTFSNVKESVSYHTNPQWEGNFKVMKEANEQTRHRDNLIYKYADLNFRKEKAKDESDQAWAKINTDEVDGEMKVSGEAFLAQELSTYSLENYQKADLQKKGDAYTASADYLIWQGLLRNDKNTWQRKKALMSEGLNDAQAISQIIAETASRDSKYTTEDAEGNVKVNMEAFRTDYTEKVKETIYNPSTGQPDKNNPLLGKYYDYHSKFQDFQNAKAVKDDIESGFNAEMSKLSPAFSELEPVSLSILGGILDGVTLTPQDQLELELIRQYGKGTLNISDSAKKKREYADKAKTRLINKLGQDEYNSIMFLKGGRGYDPLREQSNKISKAIEDVDFTDALARKDRILQNTYGKRPNLVLPIGTGDLEVDRRALERIRALADSGEGIHGNPLNENENFKQFVKDVNAEGAKLGDLSMKANVVNDDSGQAYVVLKSGTQSDKSQMTISIAQAKKIGIDVDDLYEPDYVTTLRQRINKNSSTSFGNPGIEETYLRGDSAFKNDFFINMRGPGSEKYQVQANIELDNGVYIPYIFYRSFDEEGNPVGRKLLTMPGATDLQEVVERLRQKVKPGFLAMYEKY